MTDIFKMNFVAPEGIEGADKLDQRVIVCERNRDSDILCQSNWRSFFKALGGEENEIVQIFRRRNSLVGWVEYMTVLEDSKEMEIAKKIMWALEIYSVVDEDDFSQLESETADEYWKENYTWQERIKELRQHFVDIPQNLQDFRSLKSAAKGNFCPFAYFVLFS